MAWTPEEKARKLAETRKSQEARGFKKYVDPKTGKATTSKVSKPKGSVKQTKKMTDKSGVTKISKVREKTKYDASKYQRQRDYEESLRNMSAADKATLRKEVAEIKSKPLASTIKAHVEPIASVKAPTVKAPVSTEPVTTPKQDLQSQIIDTQKKAMTDRFVAAFEKTKGRLGQEGEELTRSTRGQIGRARTADVMARAGAEKQRAGLGLGASGAASQSDIAQNVISQGAESAIGAQETALRADIERRLTEAQSLRDQGVATAETEADILNLTNQLAQLEQADADLKVKEAQTKADYLTTIGRFAGDYMAEINRVKNDGDPSNDWQIAPLEAARQQKIESQGLDQQGQPLQTGIQYTVSQALEATRQGLWNEDIANALGLPFTAQGRSQVTGGGGGGGGVTEAPITTTAPYGEAPVQQLAAYKELSESLQRGRLQGQEALAYLAKDYDTLVERFGKEVVDGMADEIYTQLNPPAEAPVEPVAVDETLPKDVQTVIDSYTNKEGVVDRVGMFSKVVELVRNGVITIEQGERLEYLYALGGGSFSETPISTPAGLNPILVN